jgi:phage shock protein PspC (stress-responsive transcriptional regulator)
MNKVININFQGRILPIEEQAYEILKQYIASLQTYFANEEGKDEIINDIECRVAELCDDRLKKGAVCINEAAINLIIDSIGRPADFEAQDGFEQTTTTANNSNTNNGTNNNGSSGPAFGTTTQKRLYRDEQNKILGGVCSGIANYFGIEPLLVRILWLFLVGVNVLGYLILWIAVPSSSAKEVGGVRKRLFRDIDNKIVGGVCAGLAKYFAISVRIVRLLFLIPFIRFIFNFKHFHLFQFWDSPDFPNFLDITFSPGAVFVYIVLWLVLPEARNSADKLEMVGEKVDLNSIKNTIQNDMEGFSKRAQAWGSEFYKAKNDQSAADNEPVQDHATNVSAKRKGLLYFIGRFITIIIKVFVYFILGIVGISLLAALFGMGVAGTSLLPLKGFLINDGIQTMALIGTILFFIWVPIIGIVTAVIRKIAGYKKSNKWVRTSFISLWVFGWVCLFYFFSSIGNSFSKHNIPEEQNISLANAKVDFLEVTTSQMFKYYDDDSFVLSPFDRYNNEDTFFVRNLRVRIVQSKTDSFQVNIVKLSNGKTVKEANQFANSINFKVTQVDSFLYLDRGIAITKNNKFRNQHIIMTIAVPIGKRIKISNSNWRQVNVKVNRNGIQSNTLHGVDAGWYDEWNEPWDGDSYSFEKGAEYRMTEKGLELLKPSKDAQLKEENQIKTDEENPLKDLKEERMEMEAEKGNPKVTVNTERAKNALVQKTSQILDFHWVLDRFSY